jgi:CheY-like chemotaxis protein
MPHTCLVVSDDEVFSLVRDLLASERRALFHAPSGVAALEWLSGRRGPTILIVDLPLADMSGAELVESVRADAELRRSVAVVCLAAPGMRAPHRAFRVVRKPSNASALVAAVDHARRQLAVWGAAPPESALDRYRVWRSRRTARGALL